MNRRILRIITIVILLVIFVLPTMAISITSLNSTLHEENTLPAVFSNDIIVVTEINENEETTQGIKMQMTFEDKLQLIQTYCDREPEPITEAPTQITRITTTRVVTDKATAPPPTIKKSEPTTEAEELESEDIEETETTEIEESTTIEEVTENNYVYSERYPVAAQVWNYLRDLGYNKAVCAGILGNMMAEVGGQTLALQPHLYGADSGYSYYGLCQWNLYYYPSIAGASVNGQLNHLANTIRSEMNTFGYKYYSGFNHNSFLNITDPGAAAKAFAVCYERCASWSYSIRIQHAYTAYDYFA